MLFISQYFRDLSHLNLPVMNFSSFYDIGVMIFYDYGMEGGSSPLPTHLKCTAVVVLVFIQ